MLPLPQWPAFDPEKPSPFFVAAAQLFNAWKRRGVSTPFVVAMVTQAEMESAFKPNVIGDRGTAYSYYQWHWNPRGMAILAATSIDVRSETDIDKIVEAAWWELNHTETKARDAIAASLTAAQASRAACIYFEGAGAADAAERRANEAERWTVWLADNIAWVEAQG